MKKVLLLILSLTTVLSLYENTPVVLLTPSTHQQIYSGYWLVKYYADWCGHCHQMAGIYEETARELQHLKGVVKVAAINAGDQAVDSLRHPIRGFPTLRWMSNGQMREYQGDRTTLDLVTFVRRELENAGIDPDETYEEQPQKSDDL